MSTELQQYYCQAMGIQVWVSKQKMDPLEKSVGSLIHSPSQQTSVGLWESLKARVASCTACRLHEGRTQTVFGVGNQQADLCIVGEAPGANEDRMGLPFVGPAGQLLDKMLKAIQLSREEVYIANVLKCRPPNNRDPLPSEISRCTPFLEQQVTLLQPKLILALGRYAAHYLLNTDLSLSRLRGKIHKFRETEVPLIVSYHPAYLLRNPSDKRKSYEDLLKVQKILNEN